MEGKSLGQSIAGTIFSIPNDGMTLFGKMHSDLVLATGQKLDFQQTESFGLFQHLVSRMGKFTFGRIPGRIDPLRGILGQAGGDRPLFGGKSAMDYGQIVFICLGPMLLQKLLGLFTFGKQQYPRGVLVQSMDHIDPVARFRVALANIVVQQIVGRSRLVTLGTDGQQSSRLFHHDDILILMQDSQTARLMLSGRPTPLMPLLHGKSLLPRYLATGRVKCDIEYLVRTTKGPKKWI